MTALSRRDWQLQTDPAKVVVLRPGTVADTLGIHILREGLVAPHDLLPLLVAQSENKRRITDLLLASGLVGEATLYQAIGRHWGCSVVDLANQPPDPRLLDAIDQRFCLREGVVPWRMTGEATVIVMAHPEHWPEVQAELAALFGPVVLAVAPMRQIETALLRFFGPEAARIAETRVPGEESCRGFKNGTLKLQLLMAAPPVALLAANFPAACLTALVLLAFALSLANSLLKMLAWRAALRTPARAYPMPATLPHISLMIALYKEVAVVERLIKRMERLDYPRDKLDLLLIVEADDTPMRARLAQLALPQWMRVLLVPEGRIKTKPRALNHALSHCSGEIIGIYDAEDAPEPGQLRTMAAHFAAAPPEVACLQGRLDYYNPHTNWLSRCFTIEYASWFRLFLPGIAALGLVVPLGGTTLFFRRDLLEKLGGWDAHNVTEDADLGLRLVRHGYRTEIVQTTTMEEANCRALPWIKQRSRWTKGYMLTWATHMRAPRMLWQQLGARRFAALQILMFGSIIQALIAPALWSMWLIPFGFAHPITASLSHEAFVALYSTSIVIEILNVCFGISALLRSGQAISPLWVPTLMLYYPMATFAAYKALWELLTRPFYWDKTSHGLFDT